MLPPTFSMHEAYGKHRNPEELRCLEKRSREALIRNYQIGDPVSDKDSTEVSSLRVPQESLYTKFARLVYPIQHVFHVFFSVFHPRPH